MEDLEEANKRPGSFCRIPYESADEVTKYAVPVETVPRPSFNQTGKEVEVMMNAFPISKFPSRPVYQYDVGVHPSCSSGLPVCH